MAFRGGWSPVRSSSPWETDSISANNAFSSRVNVLELRFKMLVGERDDLQQRFVSECNQALQSVLDNLHSLVEHVASVDKSLMFWYSKGTPLRLMLKTLKPIGQDRDVMRIMVKKGNGIQGKAELVTQGFNHCNDIYFGALNDVQSLQLKTTDLVESGIVNALEEADDLKRQNGRKQEELQLEIDKKEIDVSRVRLEVTSNRKMANDLERQKEEANKASSRSAGLSVGSAVGAYVLGIGCILFPPAGAVVAGIGALGAGAIGISAAVVSKEQRSDARRLGSEESTFRSKVSSLNGEISGLRSEIEDLGLSKDEYDKAIEAIQALEKQCELLRDRTDDFLEELNTARGFLASGVTKSQAIASALGRVEYARTREDFVDRIRSVLEDVRVGTGRHITASSSSLVLLEQQLVPLQQNSNQVKRILGKAY